MRIIEWPESEDDDLTPKYDPRTSILDPGEMSGDALFAVDEALREHGLELVVYDVDELTAFFVDKRVAP